MKSEPRRAGIVCLLVLISAWGCASKPYEPIDGSWQRPDEKLGVIYVPPENDIYVQIVTGRNRYAEFELNVGWNVLANVAATTGVLGAGYWNAVATAPSGTYVAVNPVAVGVLLAHPIVVGSVEKVRQLKARSRAARFEELGPASVGGKSFFEALQSSVSASADFRFSGHEFLLGDEETFNRRDNLLEAVPTDRVLVIGGVTAFTPRFEALEMEVFYGIFNKAEDMDKPVYSNSVIVQSTNREGLDGSDTRNGIDAIIQKKFDAGMAKYSAPRSSREKYQFKEAKRELKVRVQSWRKAWYDDYRDIDDGDLEGDVWYAEQGREYRKAYADVAGEAIRLIIADVTGTLGKRSDKMVLPPNYNRKMYRFPDAGTGSRDIYQLEEGSLISINRLSRMVPLSEE